MSSHKLTPLLLALAAVLVALPLLARQGRRGGKGEKVMWFSHTDDVVSLLLCGFLFQVFFFSLLLCKVLH